MRSPPIRDLPKFHGIYASSADGWKEIKPGTLPELTPQTEILVFDKSFAGLPANSFTLRTVSYVRYKVVGSSFSPVVDLTKGLEGKRLVRANRWQFVEGIGQIVRLRSRGLKAEPDAIVLETEKELQPAIYEFVIEGFPKGFVARFVVDRKNLMTWPER